MARRVYHIAGHAPGVKWKRNVPRAKRSIPEAVAIAIAHGVQIPDDVVFFEAAPGELQGNLRDLYVGARMETARGPRQVAENRSGNFHAQAWDLADRAVRQMRGVKK